MVAPRLATTFVSGEQASVDRVRPVLDAISGPWVYTGAFGTGAHLKYVANLLLAVHTVAAAEATVLARRAGLDLELVQRTLDNSIAASAIWKQRGPVMHTRAWSPTPGPINTLRPILDQIEAYVVSVGLPAPVFASAKSVLRQGRRRRVGRAGHRQRPRPGVRRVRPGCVLMRWSLVTYQRGAVLHPARPCARTGQSPVPQRASRSPLAGDGVRAGAERPERAAVRPAQDDRQTPSRSPARGPYLLLPLRASGHGGGTTLTALIDQDVDELSFSCWALDITPPPPSEAPSAP